MIKEGLCEIKECSLNQYGKAITNINLSFQEIGESKFVRQLSIISYK